MVVLYYWPSGLWSREHMAAEWLFYITGHQGCGHVSIWRQNGCFILLDIRVVITWAQGGRMVGHVGIRRQNGRFILAGIRVVVT